MSLKSLKTKSDDALASIPLDGGAGSGRPARPITAPGATAFMQPTIDALSQRAKEAEAKIELYEQRLKQQPVEVHGTTGFESTCNARSNPHSCNHCRWASQREKHFSRTYSSEKIWRMLSVAEDMVSLLSDPGVPRGDVGEGKGEMDERIGGEGL